MVDSFLEVDQIIISDEVGDDEWQIIFPYNFNTLSSRYMTKIMNFHQQAVLVLIYHRVLSAYF